MTLMLSVQTFRGVQAEVPAYPQLRHRLVQHRFTDAIFICPTYSMLLAFQGSAFKGEFATPPGLHGNDVFYYFVTSANPNGIPPFSNPDLDKAFPESFPNFAIALNPNVKFDQSDITPFFPPWNGSNEMLLNRTEDGAADIRVICSSQALLDRCRFWDSVTSLTAQ